MLRVIGFLLVLLTASAASLTTASADEDPNAVIKRIQASGVLRVPVVPASEPGFIRDAASGEWSGYYIEWSQEIADLLGVKLEYFQTSWGNLGADFEAGKIDIAIGMNPNPRRALIVDDVPGYMYSSIWVLAARDGFEPKTWAETNKPEVRLGAEAGSTMQVIVETMAPNAQHTFLGTLDQLALELKAGRLDAILVIDSYGARLRKQGIGHVVVPAPVLENISTISIRREAGNHGLMNFLASWMQRQRVLGLARARIDAALLEAGIDMSDIPRR